MRFVPLVSSLQDPSSWTDFPALELLWEGGPPAAWRKGPPVHAIHVKPSPTDEDLGMALHALVTLGADFLVLPAAAPQDLSSQSALLQRLEVLLEALTGRGVRVAIRPGADAQALATLLKDVRGEAIGYCWDTQVPDILAIEDRLLCAVLDDEGDPSGLAERGFRWNVAVPVQDPGSARTRLARLAEAHPSPIFPTLLPDLPEQP